MSSPLVSVIVPTKNSSATLRECLESIKQQSYTNIQLIVVDNYSTDDTLEVAGEYTPYVFTQGPERCTQRNFGVRQAGGEYVMIIDSDMELRPKVVAACVRKIQRRKDTKAVIIPEESFGESLWAECKRLERSFYVGVDWMEAARFFEKATYARLGGYDEDLISGEDWDLSQRVRKTGRIARIKEFIMHNEGELRLTATLRKKYYYAKRFAYYQTKQEHAKEVSSQTGPVARYMLFFRQPRKLFRNPLLAVSMLFMKTCEFGCGAVGLIMSRKGQV